MVAIPPGDMAVSCGKRSSGKVFKLCRQLIKTKLQWFGVERGNAYHLLETLFSS